MLVSTAVTCGYRCIGVRWACVRARLSQMKYGWCVVHKYHIHTIKLFLKSQLLYRFISDTKKNYFFSQIQIALHSFSHCLGDFESNMNRYSYNTGETHKKNDSHLVKCLYMDLLCVNEMEYFVCNTAITKGSVINLSVLHPTYSVTVNASKLSQTWNCIKMHLLECAELFLKLLLCATKTIKTQIGKHLYFILSECVLCFLFPLRQCGLQSDETNANWIGRACTQLQLEIAKV